MAGHSKFANIKHRKNAQDAKRAKLFTKLVREVVVAASEGLPEPEANPRLRHALAAARKAGVPKDRLEGAIEKASGTAGGEGYTAIRYEGYAPGGVPVIVECLTDNRNRTASEVRSAFSKNGGNLGESGSVAFLFDQVGMLVYPDTVAGEEEMFETAGEAGAEDLETEDGNYVITCKPEDFAAVRDALADKYDEPESGELLWIPHNSETASGERLEQLTRLVDALEECDDVQDVYAAFEPAEDSEDAA